MRINLTMPDVACKVLDALCDERDMTRPALIRQALGMLQVAHEAQKAGHYVGTAKDRSAFDTIIAQPL